MNDEDRTYQTSREVFATHIPQSSKPKAASEQNIKQASRELSESLLYPLQQSLAKLPVRVRGA
jgi:hypothetical protein